MDQAEFAFAIVGCGSIAPTHVDALRALAGAGITVTACVDSVPEKSAAFSEKFGLKSMSFEELLADKSIHAISFCTPSGIHGEQAILALNAGKHAIVEKPMDISLATCDRMIAAAKATGCKLAAISQHRFDPATRRVREALESGELGRILAVDARIPWFRAQDYYDSGDWRGTWELDGGGCLMNQGVHTVDLMRWLCGPLKSVSARMATAAHERIEVEDLIVGTLEFENGALGTVMASTAVYPGFAARLAIHGSEGTAIIEGDRLLFFEVRGKEALPAETSTAHALQVATGGTRSAVSHATSLATDEEASTLGTSLAWGDAHRAQLLDFVNACRTGGEPLVNGPEGRNAVEAVLALYASARAQKTVTLPLAACAS